MSDIDLLNRTTLFNDINCIDELRMQNSPLENADYEPVDLNQLTNQYYYVESNGVDELRIAPVDNSIYLTIQEAIERLK